MRKIAELISIQINVPHSVYGRCEYMMPDDLIDWIRETLNLQDGQFVDYGYVGGTITGDGYTNGITNRESVYMVRNMYKEDALAFKLTFPECFVHIAE